MIEILVPPGEEELSIFDIPPVGESTLALMSRTLAGGDEPRNDTTSAMAEVLRNAPVGDLVVEEVKVEKDPA